MARAVTCAGVAVVFGVAGLAGCHPRPTRSPTPLGAWVAEAMGNHAAMIHDVDVADDGRVVASIGHDAPVTIAGHTLPTSAALPGPSTSVVLLAPGPRGQPSVRWSWSVASSPGALALAGDAVVAAISGSGTMQIDGRSVTVRGEPGAVIVARNARDGSARWLDSCGATEWVVVTSIAALPGGDVAVSGGFAGTLRIGDRVVTSGGNSDGFVARLGAGGAVRWLIRIGGASADMVSGAAALGERIAIAGVFTQEADLRGTALNGLVPDSTAPDAFVAVIDGDGAVSWTHRVGSAADDSVAGVAVTAGGAIAVAATVRDTTSATGEGATVTVEGTADFAGRGAADGLVVIWDDRGRLRGTALLGGRDFDILRTIAAAGDELVVGGWFSGNARVGDAELAAAGGDDAFIAVLDDRAQVTRAIHVTGEGREEVAAIAGAQTGWAAAVAHTTAARAGDHALPASGAAVLFEPR